MSRATAWHRRGGFEVRGRAARREFGEGGAAGSSAAEPGDPVDRVATAVAAGASLRPREVSGRRVHGP